MYNFKISYSNLSSLIFIYFKRLLKLYESIIISLYENETNIFILLNISANIYT